MLKLNRFLIIASGAAVLLMGTLSAQTLADAARKAQKNKRTPSATGKVFTNDSLEFHAAAGAEASAKTSGNDAAKNDDAAPEKSADAAATSDEDKKKAADDIKTKFDKQKSELAQLQRELDLLQRENHMRGAVFYADAGTRLRDEKKFAEDDRKYQAEISSKQKAIADGQAALERLREEARKAGVPVS